MKTVPWRHPHSKQHITPQRTHAYKHAVSDIFNSQESSTCLSPAGILTHWGQVTNYMRNFHCGTGLIFVLHPSNERWRYFVTPSLISWAQTWWCIMWCIMWLAQTLHVQFCDAMTQQKQEHNGFHVLFSDLAGFLKTKTEHEIDTNINQIYNTFM